MRTPLLCGLTMHLCNIIVVATLPTLHHPVRATLPIIVRRAADVLLIKITIAGQPEKTLQRPATEALARSLSRVSRAFAAPNARRKRGAVDGDHELLCLLCDATGAGLDPSMSALQAWSGASRLHVGTTSVDMLSVDVLFEPAEIASLTLPAVVPFVGTPLTPSVETLGFDERDCLWLWERLPPGATADGWQHVGSGREYQPSEDDDGSRLRVRAMTPGSCSAQAAPQLVSRLAEAASPVEVPPPRRLLARRVHAMGERRGHAFRVLSYNVLADCYSRHWDQAGSVHSYCAPRLTRPAHRMPRLLGEVLAFAPDVVLLQEVDRSWYEQYWAPAMRQRGYEGAYLKKRHASSSEGVASFVRSAAFELVAVREVSLALDPADTTPRGVAPLLQSHASMRESVRKLPTVAQLLLLREATPPSHPPPWHGPPSHGPPARRHLMVANTHLYFANPAMHVRLLQTSKLLEEMHAWSAELRTQLPAASAPALVLAGDLNADATDGAIQLLTSGSVGADHPDWLHGALNWAPSLDVAGAARDVALVALATLGVCAQAGAGPTALSDGDLEAAWERLLRHSEAEDAATMLWAEPSTASLEGARRLALDQQLLRTSVERLARAQATHEPTEERAAAVRDGGGGGLGGGLGRLAAAIVSDAAAGRSLLNSEPLAAAEVARQLRLSLSVMAVRAPAADGTSWYTRAHTRLEELTGRLLRTKAALRSRVASEGGAATLAAGEDAEAALGWAARAAGVHLSHPTPLQSVYGFHSPPTHLVPRYANTLDWICIDAQRLEAISTAPRPPLEELTRDVAMPSVEWPSDHVSLAADLAWRSDT